MYDTVVLMISIDIESPISLEEQIRREIRKAIACGVVGPGDEMPPVRQLAGDLGIHWNTVARAYRKLRDEGLLIVGHGRGVFVREPPPPSKEENAKTLTRVEVLLNEALTTARLGGLSLDEVKILLENRIERWKKENPEP